MPRFDFVLAAVHIVFLFNQQGFNIISPFFSRRHENASSNLVPISGASRQFDRLMDSFASANPENDLHSDGRISPDAGTKREVVVVPAVMSKLALPERPAESAFEALRSSGVGEMWVPPLTSRGRPSPTQPSQSGAGIASRSAVRDSDDDENSGSSASDNAPDGEVAMLIQHPSLEVLESFDTDDLWESRLFWLLPLALVQSAPSDSLYVFSSPFLPLLFHRQLILFFTAGSCGLAAKRRNSSWRARSWTNGLPRPRPMQLRVYRSLRLKKMLFA
jgi:hypothetical protein